MIETYLKPGQTSKMKLFSNVVNASIVVSYTIMMITLPTTSSRVITLGHVVFIGTEILGFLPFDP